MDNLAKFESLSTKDSTLRALEDRLPQAQGDPRILAETASKLERLREWMRVQDLDGVLISRRDNFAWLTVGGDNHVLKNTETGAGHLLITPDEQTLLAYSMDARRILEEQLPGQRYETLTRRWYEGDPRGLASTLVKGRLAADTPLPGCEERSLEISRLHDPLTELEIDRCRWLGRQTALLLEALAGWVQPGMSEQQIARQMQAAFTLQGIELDVVIVGSDERVERLRHSLPTNQKVEKYVMVHPAARRWGLHANVCRSISFGKPKEAIRQAYRAAATIETQVLGMLQPGVRFADILQQQKIWYRENGFPEEWREHFQGGPTGYVPADPTRCQTEMRVVANQAYDWFITLPGVMAEELALLTGEGVEVASSGADWPLIAIPTLKGEIRVPDLLVV